MHSSTLHANGFDIPAPSKPRERHREDIAHIVNTIPRPSAEWPITDEEGH